MSELKRRIRLSIWWARRRRLRGDLRGAAERLTEAGELRRSAFYIYGPGPNHRVIGRSS